MKLFPKLGISKLVYISPVDRIYMPYPSEINIAYFS